MCGEERGLRGRFQGHVMREDCRGSRLGASRHGIEPAAPPGHTMPCCIMARWRGDHCGMSESHAQHAQAAGPLMTSSMPHELRRRHPSPAISAAVTVWHARQGHVTIPNGRPCLPKPRHALPCPNHAPHLAPMPMARHQPGCNPSLHCTRRQHSLAGAWSTSHHASCHMSCHTMPCRSPTDAHQARGQAGPLLTFKPPAPHSKQGKGITSSSSISGARCVAVAMAADLSSRASAELAVQGCGCLQGGQRASKQDRGPGCRRLAKVAAGQRR